MENRSEFRKKLPLLVIPIVGVMAIGMVYFMFFTENDAQAGEKKSAGVGVVDVNDTIAAANSKMMAYDEGLIDYDLNKSKNDNFSFMFEEDQEPNIDSSISQNSLMDRFEDKSSYNESSFRDMENSKPVRETSTQSGSNSKKTSGGGGSSPKPKSKRLAELDELSGVEPDQDAVEVVQTNVKKKKGGTFYDASSSNTSSLASKEKLSFSTGNGPSGKLFKASFFNEQNINPNGSQVSIRVNEDILLSTGQMIKANSIIYGTTEVSNSRMNIRVNGINMKGKLIQANLIMVTDEGVEGFPLEESESSFDLDQVNRIGRTVSSVSQIAGVGGRFNLPFFSSGGRKNSQKVLVPDGFSFYLIEDTL